MQVGVYVGLMLVFFGWLQWRTGERVTEVLQRHRHWAPLVGALLGVTPGCAGALLVMPLYARGVRGSPGVGLAAPLSPTVAPTMRTAAAAVGLAPTAFWSLATLGLFISIPVVFQVGDLTVLAAALGGLDPYLLVGNLGTLVAVVVFFQSRARFADDSLDSIAPAQTSMSAVLRNGAKETSFVITWVALTYVVYETAVGVTGFNAASLVGVGVAGVLVGAVVGLVPGCAIQIVFTGLYVAGGLPLPTLLANAVSQDGDALLPLLFTDRRAAAAATAITTVPALVVGLSALVLLG